MSVETQQKPPEIEESKSSTKQETETKNNTSTTSAGNDNTKKDSDSTSAAASDDGGMSGAVKENGEIDWDCPCLQGMAYGPCGTEFRAAFSCFIASEDEEDKPRGFECVDFFKNMHECMTENADHYAKYLEGADDEEEMIGEGGQESKIENDSEPKESKEREPKAAETES